MRQVRRAVAGVWATGKVGGRVRGQTRPASCRLRLTSQCEYLRLLSGAEAGVRAFVNGKGSGRAERATTSRRRTCASRRDDSACGFAAIAGASRSPGSDIRSVAARSASLPIGGEVGFGGSTDQGGRGLDRAAEYSLGRNRRAMLRLTPSSVQGYSNEFFLENRNRVVPRRWTRGGRAVLDF